MGFFYYFLKCVFIFGCAGSLLLHRDYSLVAVGRVLSVVTSVGRGEALGAQASGIAACRL